MTRRRPFLLTEREIRHIIRAKSDQLVREIDNHSVGPSSRALAADIGREWVRIFTDELLREFDQ